MAIPKKLRQEVYNKYKGKCAYTGTDLLPDWQVDHLIPVVMFKEGNPNVIDNLMPVQRIVNHYKRALPLHDFRTWFLAGLHKRLAKLPVNPKVQRSIKRKAYLLEVASLFDITPDKPFTGKFYFETV